MLDESVPRNTCVYEAVTSKPITLPAIPFPPQTPYSRSLTRTLQPPHSPYQTHIDTSATKQRFPSLQILPSADDPILYPYRLLERSTLHSHVLVVKMQISIMYSLYPIQHNALPTRIDTYSRISKSYLHMNTYHNPTVDAEHVPYPASQREV